MDIRSWFGHKKPPVGKGRLSAAQRRKLASVRDQLRSMLAKDFSTHGELAEFLGVNIGVVGRLVAEESCKSSYLPDSYPLRRNLEKVEEAIERWTHNGNGNGNGLGFPEAILGGAAKPYHIFFEGFTYATTIDFHSADSYPIKVWTFSLPDVKRLYGSIPDKYWSETYIILSDQCKESGDRLADLLPPHGPINLRYDKLTHRKIVLYSKKSILIGSANFGQTMNKETMVKIDDEHDFRRLDTHFWLNWEALEHPYIPF